MSDLLDPEDGNIINEPLSEALTKRYLAYACPPLRRAPFRMCATV